MWDTNGSALDENELEGPEVIKSLRKTAKAKFTKLLATILAKMEGDGKKSVLRVHRDNLNELYTDYIRLHTAYVEKIPPEEENLAMSNKWWKGLKKIYRDSMVKTEEFSKRKEDDGPPIRSARQIKADPKARKRKVEAELEDSQIVEERRVADIRRKAAGEVREMKLELEAAQAFDKDQRQHSTPVKKTGGPTFSTALRPGDQSTIQKQKDDVPINSGDVNVCKYLILDDWIYKPFTPPRPGAEGQQPVTMVMLPNLPQYSGVPTIRENGQCSFNRSRVWFTMCSAQMSSGAMLHSRLAPRLSKGMSQVLIAPMPYRDALQELHRKYGHPNLVVRSYIQGVLEFPSSAKEKKLTASPPNCMERWLRSKRPAMVMSFQHHIERNSSQASALNGCEMGTPCELTLTPDSYVARSRRLGCLSCPTVSAVSAEITAATSVVRLTQFAAYKDATYSTGWIKWRENY